MERLTKRLPSGAADYNYPKSCYFGDGSGADRIAQSAFRQRCVEQLAEYEDPGLTPEEVTALGKLFDYALEESKTLTEQLALLNRIRDLAEADKDGRLAVLPCKVGDKLYRVFYGEIFEHRVGSMKYFAIQGKWDIETYPFCPCVESSIGKTIFLTREEAKKALEAMKDD